VYPYNRQHNCIGVTGVLSSRSHFDTLLCRQVTVFSVDAEVGGCVVPEVFSVMGCPRGQLYSRSWPVDSQTMATYQAPLSHV
jgi:hypothetical protein